MEYIIIKKKTKGIDVKLIRLLLILLKHNRPINKQIKLLMRAKVSSEIGAETKLL